jgi:hypothetical protein
MLICETNNQRDYGGASHAPVVVASWEEAEKVLMEKFPGPWRGRQPRTGSWSCNGSWIGRAQSRFRLSDSAPPEGFLCRKLSLSRPASAVSASSAG